MIGDIMAISRLRMGTDGEGVTTLVSFFDCPLHCKYCINDFCHEDIFGESVPRGAYTPDELVELLRRDDIYFKMSGGGVTFGGGEPLLQSAFIHEVCKLADPGWKMRIETSLNVPWRNVEPIIDDMDEWIIDIKDMDENTYLRYTHMSIKKLVDNLYRIRDFVSKDKLHIRVPHIPEYNTDAMISKSVDHIRSILDIEPEIFDYIKPADIKRERYW